MKSDYGSPSYLAERKMLGNMTTSNKYLQFKSLNKGGELFIEGQRMLAKGQGKENSSDFFFGVGKVTGM